MPTPDGKLTQEEKELIARHLRRIWPEPYHCPFCQSADWIIGDHLVQPITLGASRHLMLRGAGYPNVMVISKICGYTVFFNAVVLGVMAELGEQKQSATPKESSDVKS